MALDITALRGHFPSLASGLAFFDGPGGTQTVSYTHLTLPTILRV